MSTKKRPPKILRSPLKSNLDLVKTRKAIRAVLAMREAEGRHRKVPRR